jgi:hypothetical protein
MGVIKKKQEMLAEGRWLNCNTSSLDLNGGGRRQCLGDEEVRDVPWNGERGVFR